MAAPVRADDGPVRLRTDHWRDATKLRAIRLGGAQDPRTQTDVDWDPAWLVYVATGTPAADADVWQVRQSPVGPHVLLSWGGHHPDWPLSCYVLTCPVLACPDGGHLWHHAHDCPAGDRFGQPCKRGPGRLSCWDWRGAVDTGTLTAQPSLQVLPCPDKAGRPTTCQYHGYLTLGRMS